MTRKTGREAAGSPRGEAPLRVREFLALVHEGVRGRLGDGLDGLEMRQRFSFVQYFRAGSADVHYEVWAQRKIARLEIGLHFEGERERNYEALEALALRATDLHERIGPAYEFEEWTKSWTRLHRSSEAASLTPALADDAAGQLCAFIRGMEPIIDQMELRRPAAPSPPARTPARPRGTARRRR